MTTFNQFKFEKIDNNSTITLEVKGDSCQEIVDEFISFMRGCGFMDASIYSAMENVVEEHTSYQAHIQTAMQLGVRLDNSTDVIQ